MASDGTPHDDSLARLHFTKLEDVKDEGREIDFKFPGEEFIEVFAHADALFVRTSDTVFKAAYTPTNGFTVSEIHDIYEMSEHDRIEPDGPICYLRRGNQLILSLFCDLKWRNGDLVNDFMPELKNTKLANVHRGKGIYLKPTEKRERKARIVGNNAILIELFAVALSDVPIFAQDSLPLIYIVEHDFTIIALNTETLQFMPSLELPIEYCTVVGIHDGAITVLHNSSPNRFQLSCASLPTGINLGLNPSMPIVANSAMRVTVQSDGEYSSRFLNEFVVTRVLGKGAFGCVFEATSSIDKTNKVDNELHEVRKMAGMDHPGIIRFNSAWIERPPEGWQYEADAEVIKRIGMKSKYLMEFSDDSVFIFIQMQLCNNSLKDWLENNQQPLSRELIPMKSWFRQIVCAVEYIHGKNLIHRDLKPSNVLFADANTLKLCDLGIATERRIVDDKTSMTRTIIGTELYMSPEQGSYVDGYGSKTDVFALGLILVELLIVMKVEERSEIFNNFRRGAQCDRISDRTTAEFIKQLTQLDPDNRPSCKEMLDDLFLA